MKEAFIKRHEYVVNRINNIEGLKCLKSQGAFYAFFECSTAIEKLYKAGKINNNSDLDFSNYLLDNFKVAGIPGSAFGLDGHMRFSFAANEFELKAGLDRLENALI
jgi:aspartate aminotransferase